MSLDPRTDEFDIWRDKVVVGLAGIAALAAVFSSSTSFPALNDPTTLSKLKLTSSFSELFFAIVYVILGLRPRQYVGIWELALLHRLALFAAGVLLVFNGAGKMAQEVAMNLGIFILLAAAYAFAKGYEAWR